MIVEKTMHEELLALVSEFLQADIPPELVGRARVAVGTILLQTGLELIAVGTAMLTEIVGPTGTEKIVRAALERGSDLATVASTYVSETVAEKPHHYPQTQETAEKSAIGIQIPT